MILVVCPFRLALVQVYLVRDGLIMVMEHQHKNNVRETLGLPLNRLYRGYINTFCWANLNVKRQSLFKGVLKECRDKNP